MRLLQLNPNGTEASALDFHPMVTVVNGLSARGRERVINAVLALPRGADPGCAGLVEAHGVLMDLNPATLALLDLGADLDVLIRAADMPGATSVTGIGVGALPGTASPLSPERFLDATPEGRYPELDELRAHHADAKEARAVLSEAAERARQGLAEAIQKREALDAAVAEVSSRRNRANLRLVTDEFEPDDGEDEADASARSIEEERAEAEAMIEGLTVELTRIERGLEELSGIDTRPIQVLLDAIHNPAPVEYVQSERGQELADEFVRLQGEVGVLEEALEAKGMDTASALARLDDATAELRAAEKAMRKPEFTDEERHELEAAHDEVLEAEKKARGGRAKKRLEEAMAKEQAILDRIGFPTWSAYVMGAGLMSIDPAAEQRLERARFEMEAAEAHWAEVSAAIEADPLHSELLDQIEGVYLEAFDLLHGEEPEDLEGALRNLQEEKREVTIEELADALAYQLELLGMPLEGEPSIDTIIMVAEAFLAESSAITERVAELEAERTAKTVERLGYVARLAELQAEPDAPAEPDPADEAVPEPVDERDDEQVLADLEAELATAVEDEEEYREFVEAREALLDHAIQAEMIATTRLTKLATELAALEADDAAVASAEAMAGLEPSAESDASFDDVDDVDAGAEAIEFYLLARLSALRSVSYAGSVPLVIDDALAGLDEVDARQLLDKLERMSESVQIIYLSDDPTVSGWAEAVGFERAAVVHAPPSFA